MRSVCLEQRKREEIVRVVGKHPDDCTRCRSAGKLQQEAGFHGLARMVHMDASLRATKPRINRPDVHLILVFFYGMAATFFSLLAQFLAEGTL